MTELNNEFDNRKILIIDDDSRIHEDFRKILGEKTVDSEFDQLEAVLFADEQTSTAGIHYELESAYQGEEGYQKVVKAQQQGRPYAMAFVDMRMPPGWDGLETIKQIWSVDTQIQLVICTAYSDYSWNEVLYHLGASDRLIILKKPFDMVEVQQIATALTTKWRLSCESMSRLRQVEESEEKYRAVVDSVEDAIMTLDAQGNILFVNHNPWHMINQAVGHNYYAGIKDEYRSKVMESVNQVFTTGQQKSIEYARQGDDNHTVWSEGRISPYYKDNKVVAATLVASDISARKELDWQLRHDELTGLANRAYFLAYLEDCLKKREPSQRFAVLFVDLDHFNLTNDCFGHEVGDKLLIQVAKLLSEHVQQDEMLARLGGDEFAMLKCADNGQQELEGFISLLRELLSQAVQVDGFDIYSSASIGVVIIDEPDLSANELLRDADAALYHAKSKGRNRHEYFDQEMRKRVVQRVRLGNELREAIQQDQFEVHYQPMVGLAEGRLLGFEALIRWQHPSRGLVPPDEFIPVAEETGLIFSITRMVLEKVCHQLANWKQQGLPDIKISVNCSARDFNEGKLKQIISEVVEASGVDINQLALELTESSIMEDVENSIETMRELSEMGVTISIDDFGTGYSSFSYLKQFTIAKLKIDREFIRDIPRNEDDAAIVEAIIAMAKRLKIRVVAEGVESREQLQFLQSAGCDIVQGYLLGKPMSAIQASLCLQDDSWLREHL
jgi:diguanylate cyclase (GGDEF)-like protein/PAS domain S-box-containing protein